MLDHSLACSLVKLPEYLPLISGYWHTYFQKRASPDKETLTHCDAQTRKQSQAHYLRILFIGDDANTLTSCRLFLREMDLYSELRVIQTANSLLTFSDENDYLIVLDLTLENIHNLAIYHRLRQQLSLSTSSTIALIPRDHDLEKICFTAGINEIIYKPMTFDHFGEVITRWVIR